MNPRPQITRTEGKRTSQLGVVGVFGAATLGGRFFRLYWWRTPSAVGPVEDCS
jgi:hypothetical protein